MHYCTRSQILRLVSTFPRSKRQPAFHPSEKTDQHYLSALLLYYSLLICVTIGCGHELLTLQELKVLLRYFLEPLVYSNYILRFSYSLQ